MVSLPHVDDREHGDRPRNLSYTPPFLPATASPASMISILLYPLAVSALVSASHCSGPPQAEAGGGARRNLPLGQIIHTPHRREAPPG